MKRHKDRALYDTSHLRKRTATERDSDDDDDDSSRCKANDSWLDGLYKVGLTHFYGLRGTGGGVVTENRAKAVECWQRAASKGSAKAKYFLGECYTYGEGVAKDTAMANSLYRESIDQLRKEAMAGDHDSQYLYGHAFYNGNGGLDKDLDQAYQWYLRSAKQGNVHAANNLGWCLQQGHGVEKNPAKALEWYLEGAQHSFAGAQFNAAWCFHNGCGTEEDMEKAAQWYQLAAEQDFAEALNHLGWFYENGKGGLETNLTKAFECYSKAAEKGIADAENNVAMCYYSGSGVKQDFVAAVAWFERAAAKGYGIAQFNLAFCLENKYGVSRRDFRRALELYHLAAQQDVPDAQESLRNLVDKCKESVADEDSVLAMDALVFAYQKGAGLESDDNMASAWQNEVEYARRVENEEPPAGNMPRMPLSRERSVSSIVVGRCVCCEERIANVAFVHDGTGHCCCCLRCAHTCRSKELPCPLCRHEVDRLVLRLHPSSLSASQNPKVCVSCGEAEANTVAAHGETGHLCFCWTCAQRSKEKGAPCGVCQKPISYIFLNYDV